MQYMFEKVERRKKLPKTCFNSHKIPLNREKRGKKKLPIIEKRGDTMYLYHY